ncbi:hypothetical protein [Dyella acidiphila]|uniref:DUF3551 domain-containing protein n=1 Tax=Dyella acidiphila TaxID=2775866 RepID=A0ABR9G732_9GAMM|nr:hypothetical protein [Dyella acidiphila]MBE1159857.1 hypothetical protein [Dyella acidiphila]
MKFALMAFAVVGLAGISLAPRAAMATATPASCYQGYEQCIAEGDMPNKQACEWAYQACLKIAQGGGRAPVAAVDNPQGGLK